MRTLVGINDKLIQTCPSWHYYRLMHISPTPLSAIILPHWAAEAVLHFIPRTLASSALCDVKQCPTLQDLAYKYPEKTFYVL